MNRIFLLSTFLLASCGGHTLTQIDVELEKHRMIAVVECYKSKAAHAPMVFDDARDRALVIMAEALANQNRTDSCAAIAGMNAHEAKVKIAETQNSALSDISTTVGRAATAIAGIVVGGNVLKKGYEAAGDKATAIGEGNVMGDDRSSRTAVTTTTEAVK